MANALQEQVKEFFAAANRSYSYNLKKNTYIWFGFLWGLPIPLSGLVIFRMINGLHGSIDINVASLKDPLLWVLAAHPLIFAILFGILGSVRQQKDEEVNTLIHELKIMSILDPLTGISNRRHFTHEFEKELSRTQRKKTPLSVAFFDLDHFKNVNDTHGHHMGDEILRLTALQLNKQCRPYDSPARWGGEEFVVLLPDTDEDMAYLFAERIRKRFTSRLTSSTPLVVTLSVGVAEYRLGDTLTSFVERADKALYQAKTTGRNKVVCWSSLTKKMG